MAETDPEVLLERCAAVVREGRWVAVDERAAARVAVPERFRGLPAWDDAAFSHVPEDRAVAWLLVYNAINYSYWPDAGPRWWLRVDGRDVGRDDEALAVMAAVARVVRREDWIGHLASAPAAGWLAPAPGAGVLPLLPERAAALDELVLAWPRFGGAEGLLAAAAGSAVKFAAALVSALPSWEDTRQSAAGTLFFRKRAQLCAAMVHGRLGGVFADAGRLTAFADYRLPQVLRELGVMAVEPGLAARIAAGERLGVGAAEEVELRAATVVACDAIARSAGLSALEVDQFLWRTGVERDASLPPFHRTRCTDY